MAIEKVKGHLKRKTGTFVFSYLRKSQKKEKKQPVEYNSNSGCMLITILFSISILLLSFKSHSQVELPVKDGKVFYSSIENTDSSLTKKEVFDRLLLWIAKDYNNANEVIKLKDESQGIIVVKAGFNMKMPIYSKEPNGLVSYTLTLSCKDGKYKYEISDFLWDDFKGDTFYFEECIGKTKKIYQITADRFNMNIGITIAMLNKFMREKMAQW